MSNRLETVRLATSFVFVAGILCCASQAHGQQDSITFLGVGLDSETLEADSALRQYLLRRDVHFVADPWGHSIPYEDMIDTLVAWNDSAGPFIARVTPYVFVAAEMLGAKLEVLAAYQSEATQHATYHSYFVVARDKIGGESAPELDDLLDYLKERPEPATFIYHSKFSTSSYFLPSLTFRANQIFSTDEESNTQGLTRIHSRQEGSSSSNLVRLVATGQYDLAAVWDGTKEPFTEDSDLRRDFGRKVYFIKLPTPLPNDLLVTSAGIQPEIRQDIENAISNMTESEISVGDFRTWVGSNKPGWPDAMVALSGLRWLARERPAPAIVDINEELSEGVDDALMEAAKQAVLLAGTEFTLYDEHYHKGSHYVWALEPLHDGAVTLRSRVRNSAVEAQEFQISFASPEDLTRRIGILMHSRMHRIRYLWPYKADEPTVIRDVSFAVPAGDSVVVRRITWRDPVKADIDDFSGSEFRAEVTSATFHKFELNLADFLANDASLESLSLDPMSNVAYRVILLRPDRERRIFRAFTVVFILLLVTAAGFTVFLDLRRAPRQAAAPAEARVPVD